MALLLAPESDDDLERLILAHSPRFQALLENSWNKIKEGHGLSSEMPFGKPLKNAATKKPRKNRHQQLRAAGPAKSKCSVNWLPHLRDTEG